MQRLDMMLVEKGLSRSRTLAQKAIAENRVSVFINNQWQVITKPGIKLDSQTDVRLEVLEEDQFVSRGALKLRSILSVLPFPISGSTCLDVGQSTGGFTECLLNAGAQRVVGVDVGHDQLAESLRHHPKVICLEGINARALPLSIKQEWAPDGFDLAVMDVSFISQTKILPTLQPFIRRGGGLVSLVKPQFEVGREAIGKGGIVKDQTAYLRVKQNIMDAVNALGMQVLTYQESPITGGDGNREFLLVAINR